MTARFCRFFCACAWWCIAAMGGTTSVWAQQGGSYDQFQTAIIRDQVAPIVRLLSRGFDINTPNPDLQPPLVFALKQESWDVARFFIERSELDIESKNLSGENALMMAAIKGQTGLVERLLQRKAQVNKPGWTPLHYAATHDGPEALAITRLLIEHHAFIDATSPNGTTPLMMAAQYGLRDVVSLLLKEGADPSIQNERGLTAADFARLSDRPDLADQIHRANANPAGGTW